MFSAAVFMVVVLFGGRFVVAGGFNLLLAVEKVNAAEVVTVNDVSILAKVGQKAGNVLRGDVQVCCDFSNGKGFVVAELVKDIKLLVGTGRGGAGVQVVDDFNELRLVVGFKVFNVVGGGVESVVSGGVHGGFLSAFAVL